MFCQDIKAYVKGCNTCLASKAIRYKSYSDLQQLPVPTMRKTFQKILWQIFQSQWIQKMITMM